MNGITMRWYISRIVTKSYDSVSGQDGVGETGYAAAAMMLFQKYRLLIKTINELGRYL